MLMYVTDLIYEGKISTKNDKMSTLIGRISDDRGRKFNKLISDILSDMEVFVIDSNVDRINKKPVADKNGNTLGDIDVLIIDRLYFCKFTNWTKAGHPFKPVTQKFLSFYLSSKEVNYIDGVPTDWYIKKRASCIIQI